jgi:hypothetical protein
MCVYVYVCMHVCTYVCLCMYVFHVMCCCRLIQLAKKKTYPALYALYRQGLIPSHATIVGFARSPSTDAEFRQMIGDKVLKGGTAEQKQAFLQRCFYTVGQYGDPASYQGAAYVVVFARVVSLCFRIMYCMYACVHVFTDICVYVCIYVQMYVCMYVCMHVCMHVCMYVCVYVCV